MEVWFKFIAVLMAVGKTDKEVSGDSCPTAFGNDVTVHGKVRRVATPSRRLSVTRRDASSETTREGAASDPEGFGFIGLVLGPSTTRRDANGLY